MSDPISAYDARAEEFAAQYESVSAPQRSTEPSARCSLRVPTGSHWTSEQIPAGTQRSCPNWGSKWSPSSLRQARIVALLAERADISTNGLDVRLRVDGLDGLAREKLASGVEQAA